MDYKLTRKELKNKGAFQFKDGDVINVENGRYYIWIEYGQYTRPSLLTRVEPRRSMLPLKLHQIPQYISDFIHRRPEEIKIKSEPDSETFKFSKHGIKDQKLFSSIYSDFIEWCKNKVPSGTFSTYVDGEPVCFYSGMELSYRTYLKNC